MDAWWRSRGATPAGVVHIYRCEGRAPLSSGSHIHEALRDDVAAVARLHEEAFPRTYLAVDDMLADPPNRKVLVADRGQACVGYVCAERQPDGTGYIHYLAVDPTQRRQGLGRDLLLAALHWLHVERSVSETALTVADENDARSLYEQAGFALLATGQTFDLHLKRQRALADPELG